MQSRAGQVNADLQRANDLIAAVQGQRDQALNALAIANADLTSARREILALKERFADSSYRGDTPQEPVDTAEASVPQAA
jgi:hypothetical protein